MKSQKIVLTLLTLALPVATPAQTRSAVEYMAAIEGKQATAGPNDLSTLTISELMARFNVPGVSIAVIRDYQIHWAKGYGIADVETGAPVNAETMFQAASISKPVAAMATLRAVQDGLFTLDTDINKILTSWKLDLGQFAKDGPVTPRGLTSHTSGLGDGFGFPGYDPADSVPTVVQFLQGSKLSNVGSTCVPLGSTALTPSIINSVRKLSSPRIGTAVVLPEPPLKFVTAMTWRCSPSRRLGE